MEGLSLCIGADEATVILADRSTLVNLVPRWTLFIGPRPCFYTPKTQSGNCPHVSFRVGNGEGDILE